MNRKCEDCHFYEHIGFNDDGENQGHCRRYPPALDHNYVSNHDDAATESDLAYVLPIILGRTDWCGEFKTNITLK